MSKYRKFVLFVTTLVATLAFVFTGGVINAQKLTVSGIDENGNVTSSKSYTEDDQDFYEVKIKANKKQAIYLLADNDGNDPEHYSVIDKDKTNKKGKYTYNLASVNGEEAVYYISTDKSLKNKSKKATFNIDKIKNKVKVVIPATEGTVAKDPSAYQQIPYDSLARSPKEYKGKDIKISGTVFQVINDERLLIAVDGNYDSLAYVELKKSALSDDRILEDDNVTLYGVSKGIYSYQTTNGDEKHIPSMTVLKIDNAGQ